MRSLKQEMLFLVIGPLVLLAFLLTLLMSFHVRESALVAAREKAKSDLATGETIINSMYPGPWEVKGDILYKGGVKINNNNAPVEKISSLTGDTVTIFRGAVRVTTTVRNSNGQRAVGTKVSETVAANVLRNGQEYLGEANVVGEKYQTAYKPLRDANGNIIGMFYVGLSKKFVDDLVKRSLLITVAVSSVVTLLVAMAAWYFTQKAIISPLQQITNGTKEVAFGRLSRPVKLQSHNEIGQLASAFNQMVEGLEKLSQKIDQSAEMAAQARSAADIPTGMTSVPSGENRMLHIPPGAYTHGPREELPKGLNEATLQQIVIFLESCSKSLSAEEVGLGINLTRVTARRYLEYLEKNGRVVGEIKYGTVGRPVKLYKKYLINGGNEQKDPAGESPS